MNQFPPSSRVFHYDRFEFFRKFAEIFASQGAPPEQIFPPVSLVLLISVASVADQGCLSRIPDPDFYPYRIPDPKTAMKDRVKKICCHTFFFGAINFIKLNYFIFEMLNKKIWANFQRIIELFTQKIITKLSKIWVWDPGSEIRDPEKTYSGSQIPNPPGVKRAPDLGSKEHRISDPQHCRWQICHGCQRYRRQICHRCQRSQWQWEQLSNFWQLKMNLKKKFIYMLTLPPNGVQKKSKNFSDWIFFPIATGLELRISPGIFEKIRTALMV
jgi:hypothetical protein